MHTQRYTHRFTYTGTHTQAHTHRHGHTGMYTQACTLRHAHTGMHTQARTQAHTEIFLYLGGHACQCTITMVTYVIYLTIMYNFT